MPAVVINVWAEIPGDVPNDQVDLIVADGTGEPIVLYEATPATGGFKPWFSPEGNRILFSCSGWWATIPGVPHGR